MDRPALGRRVLWIGGAQWAGKTSAAALLAERHGLVHYQYDEHDARGHYDRVEAHPERYPHRFAFQRALREDPDAAWVTTTPEQMAADALLHFAERFEMVLEDLAALPGDAPVVAEGYGLRPDLVAPHLASRREAAFLVPSEAFRATQATRLERARSVAPGVSDPQRAIRNRLERDRLLAADVERSAATLGLRVIVVDGSRDLAQVVRDLETHFGDALPRPLN